MPIHNNVLLLEDSTTGLKFSLDFGTGLSTLSDGKSVAVTGKFKKTYLKTFLKDFNAANSKRGK